MSAENPEAPSFRCLSALGPLYKETLGRGTAVSRVIAFKYIEIDLLNANVDHFLGD